MTSSYQTVVDSTDEINKASHLEWEQRLTGSALSIHITLYLHITHNSSVNNAYFSDFGTFTVSKQATVFLFGFFIYSSWAINVLKLMTSRLVVKKMNKLIQGRKYSAHVGLYCGMFFLAFKTDESHFPTSISLLLLKGICLDMIFFIFKSNYSILFFIYALLFIWSYTKYFLSLLFKSLRDQP